MSTKSKTSTPFRVVIISTGGTIEKTYCELGGVLSNQVSVLDVLLANWSSTELKYLGNP